MNRTTKDKAFPLAVGAAFPAAALLGRRILGQGA
jgi:hypothetical protein